MPRKAAYAREASAEKASQAETGLRWIRAVIVAITVTSYLFVLRTGSSLFGDVLAGVTVAFAVAMFAVPWNTRGSVLLRSAGSATIDLALAALWVVATGGLDSPFFVLWLAAIGGVFFRFDPASVAVAASASAIVYVAVAAATEDLPQRATDVGLNLMFFAATGAVGIIVSRESLRQIQSKLEMRDRMEEARTAEAKFRGLLEAAPDAILVVDARGKILIANGQATQMFGYSGEELLNRTIEALVPHRFADRHATHRANYGLHPVGRPMGAGLDRNGLRKDGTEFPVEISLSPLETETGPVVMSVVRDLTERRKAERDLARLASIPEETPEPILEFDGGGRVTYANPAARRELADLEARSDRHPVLEGYPEIRTRLATGSVRAVAREVRIRERVFEASYYTASEGGVRVYMADVTDRRRAETELRLNLEREKELERLKEIDHLKTLFINSAAHELKTPLTPIKLQVHILRRGARAWAPHEQKSLDILDRNVDRLSQLVTDVLDVARLQASRLGVSKQQIDLNRVVLEAVESFQESAKVGGIALESRLSPDLVVHADPKRLTQVLFNLLSNALKFTPPDGAVTITTSRAGDFARVTVSDTGTGFTPEAKERLFKPFSQVHDTTRSVQSGTGLGLYISRGIVELHGGTIEAFSEGLGGGSSFTFTMPILADHEAPPPPPRPRIPSPPAQRPEDKIAKRARELI